LIGNYDHWDAPAVSGGNHFRSSRNNDNILDPPQRAGILNDCAIAVQKQRRPAKRRAPHDLAPDTFRIERVFSRFSRFEHRRFSLAPMVFLSTTKSC